MTQQSEIIALALALALAPIVVWTYRGISLPAKPLLAWGLGAMLGAYAATVMESFFGPVALNLLEHLLFAVAGVCFAVLGCVMLWHRFGSTGDDAP